MAHSPASHPPDPSVLQLLATCHLKAPGDPPTCISKGRARGEGIPPLPPPVWRMCARDWRRGEEGGKSDEASRLLRRDTCHHRRGTTTRSLRGARILRRCARHWPSARSGAATSSRTSPSRWVPPTRIPRGQTPRSDRSASTIAAMLLIKPPGCPVSLFFFCAEGLILASWCTGAPVCAVYSSRDGWTDGRMGNVACEP